MSHAHPIYVFRHGRTEWNALERMQGALDSPLDEQGRAQARALGLVLCEVLRDLTALAARAPVAAFSHGAVGRLLRGAYAGLATDDITRLDEPQDAFFRLQDGAVTRIVAA